ncbi:MAG: hypothetical protein ACMUJM_02730 [bacterium]
MNSKHYIFTLLVLLLSTLCCCSAHVKIPQRILDKGEKPKEAQLSDQYTMLLLEKVLSLREIVFSKIKDTEDEDFKARLAQLDQQLETAQAYIVESVNEVSERKAIKSYDKALHLLLKQIEIEKAVSATKEDIKKTKISKSKEENENDLTIFYKKITEYFSHNEYEEIITAIDALPFPKEELPLEMTYIYAVSLEHQGKEAQASFVVSKVLQGYSSTAREGMVTLYNIGNWLLERRDFEGALRAFNYITEDFRRNNQWYIKAREKIELYSVNFQELLAKVKVEQAEKLLSEGAPINEIREILKEIESRCPSCPSGRKAMELDQDLADKQADELEKIYETVNELIQDHEFERAMGLLEQIKDKYSIYEDDPNLRYLLSLLPDKVNMVKRTEGYVKKEEEEKIFSQGKTEYERGNYKKALAIFEKSLETSLADEAESMIKQCINQIVSEERKRSADSFLKAQKETDPQKKKKLLQESYDILYNVLQEYSQTTYTNKIKANLKMIENELKKVK